ncbi:MAG: hypothetical protein NC212_03440 [Staphylococcus sp.]|nr:hypothetical protein [Staphylococcus sp.]
MRKRVGNDIGGEKFSDNKLPGCLIYQDEDLDDAAARVLMEQTGLSGVSLTQFKAFGSKGRTSNPRDLHWLQNEQAVVERIVTIAYFSLVKLDKNLEKTIIQDAAEWRQLNDLGQLAFDHNQIIEEAMNAIKRETDNNRALVFDLLPKKFTASQLRMLMQLLSGKQLDVRNFHKKISQLPYIVPLDERQQGVAHRAARFYRFDKKAYSGSR